MAESHTTVHATHLIPGQVKLMHEPQALVSPRLQLTLVERRLLRQRIGLETDDTESGFRGDVDGIVAHGDIVHPIARQPMLGAEILKRAVNLADRTGGCPDPEIPCESGGEAGRILYGKPRCAIHGGESHSSEHADSPIRGDIESAAET